MGMAKVEPPPTLQNVPIMYKGKEVAQVNGTIPEYRVEIWAGSHPAWQGKKARVIIDDSSCVSFRKSSAASQTFSGTRAWRKSKKTKGFGSSTRNVARRASSSEQQWCWLHMAPFFGGPRRFTRKVPRVH